jgi:Ca2+-transporting ATPase
MGYVMAIRSNRDSIFTIGLFSNRAMILAVVFTTLLQVAILYIPFTQELLEIQALAPQDLLVCFVLSTSLFFVVEFQKWLIRRREQA